LKPTILWHTLGECTSTIRQSSLPIVIEAWFCRHALLITVPSIVWFAGNGSTGTGGWKKA